MQFDEQYFEAKPDPLLNLFLGHAVYDEADIDKFVDCAQDGRVEFLPARICSVLDIIRT